MLLDTGLIRSLMIERVGGCERATISAMTLMIPTGRYAP